MRKGCERRRSSEIGIVDKVKDLGAMVDTIAPGVFSGIAILDTISGNNRKELRICVEKECMLWYSRRSGVYSGDINGEKK